MDGLKTKALDSFQDRNDLLTKIENLERKTAVIPRLESHVHEMKHREKIIRSFPNSSSTSSGGTDATKGGNDEKMTSLMVELEGLRTKLKRLEEELERKETEKNKEIAAKNEEIRSLNKQIQKMIGCWKIQLTEKDNAIRELNETVVDLKGQIRVAIRVRELEKEAGPFTLISQKDVKFEQNGQPSIYHFEHLFQPETSQSAVFDEIKELILCALYGRNVCLIAYGPTGSGKTFTMRGADDSREGVIPRAIRFLLDKSTEELAAIGWKYQFSASFIEVYNEEVFDLLDERKKLEVKINGSTTSVVGLRKLPIKGIPDVDVLLSLADSQRSTASTVCNLQSSRSHAVFQIYMDGARSSGETVKCCLNLVDLAGSERAKESGAQGKQFQELTNINQSLSTLKKCIRAQMQKSSHVPYRDSKLTMLLREYLGAGSSKTMFIAHVNPRDVAETRRTLEFTADLRSTSIGKSTIQTGQKN